jgi:DNA repair protein RadC
MKEPKNTSSSVKAPPKLTKKRQPSERTFTNDLAQAALDYVPLAVNFQSVESYTEHLQNVLPYNSASSRNRYASNIVNRYFADGNIQTPLTRFLGYETDKASWQTVLFYETAKVERTLKLVAEKNIWPALPAGKITREQLRNYLATLFPDVSDATMKRMLYSIFNVYTILNKAQADKDLLRFQIREGTLASFLYVLAAECPEPGIYEMSVLEAGPMRRWLLWDRDWMRRQLYNLQDLGILAKVNEIDTIRQFTLTYSQCEVLDRYYQNPQRTTVALREKQNDLVSK